MRRSGGLLAVVFWLACWMLAPTHAAAAPATDDFHFQFSRFEAFEHGGVASVVVVRSGVGPVKASIDFSTADLTALAGSDYESTSGTLVFEVGETAKRFNVRLLDDGKPEPAERLQLMLSNPQGGAVTSVGEPAVLVIADDDPPEAIVRPSANRSVASPVESGSPVLTAPAVRPSTPHRVRPSAAAHSDGAPTVLRTFELNSPTAHASPSSKGTTVSVGLVLVAALLLGRAMAKVWFHARGLGFTR